MTWQNISKQIYKHFLLLWILIIMGFSALAQSDSTANEGHTISVFGNVKSLVTESFLAGVDFSVSPFKKWDKNKVVRTSIVFGTASVAYFFVDEPLNSLLNEEFTAKHRKAGRAISEMGNPLIVGSAILGFEVLGHTLGNSKLNRVAFLSAQSFAISMSFCYAAKYAIGRLRPNYTNNHDMWYGPNWGENPKRSFFSGHTTALFSLTTVVAMEYGHIRWIPPVVYTLAGSVAVSRLAAGDHWTSDVVFSALFTHLVARSVVKRWGLKEKKNHATPVFSSNGLGLQWLF